MRKTPQLGRRYAAGLMTTAATLAMLSVGSVANAQDEQSVFDGEFEEIMVTSARKREESIFETPTALSVFGESALKALNVSNMDDVGKYVPNLNVSRFGVGNTAAAAIFIRGIGIQDHLITTDPGVGVYLDGCILVARWGPT